MMKSAFIAILLCLSLSTITALGQSESVNQIRVVSRWSGRATGPSFKFVVTRKSGAYLANGKKIPGELIANLLSAIDAPQITKPNSASIGITQEWLNANAETSLEAYARHISVAPNQRELFLSSFKDLDIIERLVSQSFDGRWTHDYPSVEVTITRTDGREIKVSSNEQYPFMLPWTIHGDRMVFKTYNADISRAIASLMPEGFVNKQRLASGCGRKGMADCSFSMEVAGWVMNRIGESWESLNAENKTKPYLDQLRRSFNVLNAKMEPDRNDHYSRMAGDQTPMRPNLLVTLSQPGFPVLIHASLPFENEKVENVDGFLKSIERHKDIMLSSPWLKNYLMNRPDFRFELSFNGDRFFSKQSMEDFSIDMEPYQLLVDLVKAAQKDICLLKVYGPRASEDWLILPDRRMALWRFSGDEPLLKWNTKRGPSRECKSHYRFRCDGAVIMPDGESVSK